MATTVTFILVYLGGHRGLLIPPRCPASALNFFRAYVALVVLLNRALPMTARMHRTDALLLCSIILSVTLSCL